MKHTLTTIVALSVLVLGMTLTASADGANRLRADIPFSFFAGSQQIPAGVYVFDLQGTLGRASGSTVLIRNMDGRVVHLFTAIPGASTRAATCLVFNRYGSSYFLSKLQNTSVAADVAKTPAEREMALAYSSQPGKSVVIAAAR